MSIAETIHQELSNNATASDTASDSASLISTEKRIDKKRRNPLVRFALMIVRRSHLYFGLLLVPWALLYGITAYLFNHPTHFSGTTIKSIENATYDELAPSRWNADDRARIIVSELQRRYASESKSIELLAAPAPKMVGSSIAASFDQGNVAYSLTVPIDSPKASLRVSPKRVEPERPKTAFFETEGNGGPGGARGRGRGARPTPPMSQQQQQPGLKQPNPNSDAQSNRSPILIDEGLGVTLGMQLAKMFSGKGAIDHDIEPKQLRITSVPELVFFVKADGESWECRHNPLTGALNTKPEGSVMATAEPSWRRFLLRLHTAHTYPDEVGARWYWAVIVDVMAFVMVFWGVSGIVMWWQIKSTRRFGTVAMLVSLIFAAWLVYAMFVELHRVV